MSLVSRLLSLVSCLTSTVSHLMSVEIALLQKIAYGHTPEMLADLQKTGTEKFVESQLNPIDERDETLQQKLSAATLRMEYEHNGKKVNEHRKLNWLNADLPSLWKLNNDQTAYAEKIRPAQETAAATCLRAVYSRWKLREVMTEFWHNHFSINAEADERIGITLPLYDKLIRQHVFGNFREMLEAVAKSPAMLYYLDNYQSKASPANENYARELFELHTLGSENYYNHLYNRWREVPGANEGKPIGYIDEDVYEAARAFTGWTVADGAYDEKGGNLPNTGQFHYFEGWHDNYQKRVLGTEFPPNQPPLTDGRQVLDLVAYHPATAKFLCTKLCRRFVADEPPVVLVEKAVQTWTKHQKSPDQLKHVLRTIVYSDEFLKGQKIKRPFELAMSFLRATQLNFTPTLEFLYLLQHTGYRLFHWKTPTGHPDTASYWLNTNLMLQRWNLLSTLMLEDWHKSVTLDLTKQNSVKSQTSQQIVQFWTERFFGKTVPETIKIRAMNYLSDGGSEEEPPPGNADEIRFRSHQMIALLGMSPAFQYR